MLPLINIYTKTPFDVTVHPSKDFSTTLVKIRDADTGEIHAKMDINDLEKLSRLYTHYTMPKLSSEELIEFLWDYKFVDGVTHYDETTTPTYNMMRFANSLLYDLNNSYQAPINLQSYLSIIIKANGKTRQWFKRFFTDNEKARLVKQGLFDTKGNPTLAFQEVVATSIFKEEFINLNPDGMNKHNLVIKYLSEILDVSKFNSKIDKQNFIDDCLSVYTILSAAKDMVYEDKIIEFKSNIDWLVEHGLLYRHKGHMLVLPTYKTTITDFMKAQY